jgi:hypothetical protein
MTHPIAALQAALVAALRADSALAALVGSSIFDALPRGAAAPFIVVARHDLVPRDGDAAAGNDHRVILHLWHPDASRKAVLALADRVLAVALGGLAPSGLLVTNAAHERTDTAIDFDTGAARAAITLRFFTEASA